MLALGAGTGILALMSAAEGAGTVTSVERSKAMYSMAKLAIRSNRFELVVLVCKFRTRFLGRRDLVAALAAQGGGLCTAASPVPPLSLRNGSGDLPSSPFACRPRC